MIEPLAVETLLGGVLGVLIGSFLNVVIHRTPLMMYRGWLSDALTNLSSVQSSPTLWQLVFGLSKIEPSGLTQSADAGLKQLDALPPLTLAQPSSRCGSCGHRIRWYENVPVISFALLRGYCSSCKHPISWRYPLVEIVTGVLFAVCAHRFGVSGPSVLWATFCALLLCQFMIDLDTQLLPDDLNYALLWLGLIGSVLDWTGVTPQSAIWGAFTGYLFFWAVAWLFRKIRGIEGLGAGDFKLLAGLGTWFGANYLLAIVLVSSLVGIVLWIVLRVLGKVTHKDIPISFGPCIAGTGIVCFVLGPGMLPKLIPFAFPLISS